MRPGMLTRSRANRRIKTPGGRNVIHRQKFYRTKGICAISGDPLQLPRNARQGRSYKSSRSSKRPNRPYGGVVSSKALRRGIISQIRE
ncbi:MAG: 50S ribosomal protein L34e [Candidatus Thorarchaeota archaeon]